MRMAKLGMGGNTKLFSMHWSRTEKAEMRRRDGCAAEEQEESVDGEVGHDAVWFGTARHHGHVVVALLALLLALLERETCDGLFSDVAYDKTN
jgi:hypothetical protein